MKVSEIHPVLLEALMAHEALRRLHFLPAEIYFATHGDGRIQTILKADSRTFSIDCGRIPDLTRDEIHALWADTVERTKNQETLQQLGEAFMRSDLVRYRRGAELVMALLNCGITLRMREPAEA